MRIIKLFDDFLSLLYPRICFACGNALYRNEEVICTFCRFRLPKTNFHLHHNNPLEQVFWGRISIERAYALYYYTKQGKVQKLLHQFKYCNHPEIGRFLGKMYGYELKRTLPEPIPELIIPVPLHPKKQRKRGYNQSEQFAIGLSQGLQIQLNTRLLIRTKASETQTRKSRFSRWENVKEIFHVNDPESLSNTHILLTDDIITTGATIEACAALLLQIPGVKLSVVSIACTMR
ncbi:MAG TPA: hypothetical protein VLH16_02805 [Bacteroidales bacterium]|nr:hypothetical protein [Bacteroidales bacterium]